MGDVIVNMPVKSAHRDRARTLPLYFDSGSFHTFVREDVAETLGHALPLPSPEVFHGLGDGRFTARQAIRLLICIKQVWCTYMAWVGPTNAMSEGILIGHDFMQGYNIRLHPKRRSIIVSVEDLKRARRAY